MMKKISFTQDKFSSTRKKKMYVEFPFKLAWCRVLKPLLFLIDKLIDGTDNKSSIICFVSLLVSLLIISCKAVSPYES